MLNVHSAEFLLRRTILFGIVIPVSSFPLLRGLDLARFGGLFLSSKLRPNRDSQAPERGQVKTRSLAP